MTGVSAQRRARGVWAEDLAEVYLGKRGLRTMQRNYFCRGGEIDLVCLHEDRLVFVEVRYRQRGAFGSGAETIGSRKQSRIIRTAAMFLSRHRPDSNSCGSSS